MLNGYSIIFWLTLTLFYAIIEVFIRSAERGNKNKKENHYVHD